MKATRKQLLILVNRPDVVTGMVRAFQYESLFADSPFEVRTYSRIPVWLTRLGQFWPRRRWTLWLLHWLERLVQTRRDRRILALAARSDIVYAITMSCQSLHEGLLRGGATLVMDIVDGLWLPWFRQFGWEHLETMLASAHGVICENPITADYVRRWNPRVELAPDSPQLELFDARREQAGKDRESKPDDRLVLGWIGGKDTSDALYVIYEALERLFARYPGRLHLRILGAPIDRLPRFEKVEYSVVERYDQARMIEESLRMDIGLYPQFDVEESRNRGTLKAKVYMAAGSAVVCQRIGVNVELIDDGRNGLLADSSSQWFEKLDLLVRDEPLRLRLAEAGLRTIRESYGSRRCFQRLVEALNAIDESRRSFVSSGKPGEFGGGVRGTPYITPKERE